MARAMLVDVADVEESDQVRYVDVPYYDAVMLYACRSYEHQDAVPELYNMLRCTERISEYNKIVISYVEGRLFLVLASGRNLMLCNSFDAIDFTTAEYFLFLAMKKFQLNPEVSTLYCRTPLTSEQELTLYRYFHSVEKI